MRLHLAAIPLVLSLDGCAGLRATQSAGTTVPAPTGLAYLARSDGYWQVWVSGEDGSSARAVTSSPVDKLSASWFATTGELLVVTQDGTLLRVDPERRSEEPLKIPFTGIRDAALSPEARRVAFSLTQSDSPDANEIWICNLDGSPALQLTNRERPQQSPAWDPSGAWIYYESSLGPGAGHDLWRASVDGSSDERLTFGGAYRMDVAIARDGAIAYSGNEAGPYDLWLKLPGREPIRLTADAPVDSQPMFSATGDVIFFESTRDGRPNIWRISRAGGEASQVTRQGEAGARRPAPRPARVAPQ